MNGWLRKEGFDKYKIIGTAIAGLLTMGLAVVVRPILILTMQVTLWTWVTFISGPFLGYAAQYASDKVVAAMCGGAIAPNHANGLLLDALRSLVYAAFESAVCIIVFMALIMLPR